MTLWHCNCCTSGKIHNLGTRKNGTMCAPKFETRVMPNFSSQTAQGSVYIDEISSNLAPVVSAYNRGRSETRNLSEVQPCEKSRKNFLYENFFISRKTVYYTASLMWKMLPSGSMFKRLLFAHLFRIAETRHTPLHTWRRSTQDLLTTRVSWYKA